MTTGNTVPRPTSGDTVHFEKERGITAITIMRGVAHVVADFPQGNVAEGRLVLLQTLAAESVPVFLVKLTPLGLTFALRENHVDAGRALLEAREVSHALQPNLAIVTILAGAMRDLSGVMAAIYEVLVAEGIAVQQTGDAYNAVLCLVEGEHANRAAAVLRERFGLPSVAEEGEG